VSAFAVLRHRDFARFALARLFATISWQILSVAVGWQVYALTRDPLALGLIGLAQFVPFVVLVLPAGQVADRIDRRLVIVAAYAIELLSAATMLVFTLGGGKDVRVVYAAMALFGAGRAFWMPTGQAMTPNLVPREDFPSAVALNSGTFEFSAVAGPALGGVLYLLGPAIAYGTVAAMLAAVVFLMLGIRPVRAASATVAFRLRDVLEGLRFVYRQKIVLGAISLDLFAVLFGGATALLPMYAADVLHSGPVGLGVLRAAPGVGAAVAAIALAVRPIRRHVGAWMFGGVALFGGATIVFGFSTVFGLSLAALVLLGVGDMVSVFIRHILVQTETPDAIRGRVSAVNAMFIGASNELGEFESGVTARWFGLVPAVVFGGCATLAVVGAQLRLFPGLRGMDRFPEPKHD
jgi:MFS family permease